MLRFGVLDTTLQLCNQFIYVHIGMCRAARPRDARGAHDGAARFTPLEAAPEGTVEVAFVAAFVGAAAGVFGGAVAFVAAFVGATEDAFGGSMMMSPGKHNDTRRTATVGDDDDNLNRHGRLTSALSCSPCTAPLGCRCPR